MKDVQVIAQGLSHLGVEPTTLWLTALTSVKRRCLNACFAVEGAKT